jgi:hypothetical protein
MERAGESVADLIQQFVCGGRDAAHLSRDLVGPAKLHQNLRDLVALGRQTRKRAAPESRPR